MKLNFRNDNPLDHFIEKYKDVCFFIENKLIGYDPLKMEFFCFNLSNHRGYCKSFIEKHVDSDPPFRKIEWKNYFYWGYIEDMEK